jgi:SAM-dependent methyltransferase
LIEAARVEIAKASVSQLPFADGTFDLVTAVETHYYWPDLVKSLREIRWVLKPGATLMIVAESYKGGGVYGRVQQLAMKPLRAAVLSVEESRRLFSTAGFSEVEAFPEPSPVV